MARGTKKQERQRKLAWALYICTGFRDCARSFIPDNVPGKDRALSALEDLIHTLYSEMERI